LEKLADYEFEGEMIPASRLGYRMTGKFMRMFFGRIFLHPDTIFTPEMLRPELQDPRVFADSVRVIAATHARVAKAYFADGTVGLAVPPIRALLEIMAHGASAEGWTLESAELRGMFTRESVLAADWYAARLDAKQAEDIRRCEAALAHLQEFIDDPRNESAAAEIGADQRIAESRAYLEKVSAPSYRQLLVGTLGRQAEFRL
jgi:hypothetical protein